MNIERFNSYSDKIPPVGESSKIFPKHEKEDQNRKERKDRKQPPKPSGQENPPKISDETLGKNIDEYC